MNSKVVLGGLGVAALIAILYFGHSDRHAAVSQPPAKTAPAPANPKEPVKPKVVYHRVNPDGSQGEAIECTSIKSFAEGKSPSELAAIARQYGVSVETVKTWFVCIQD